MLIGTIKLFKPVPSFRFGLFYFLLQQNYNNPVIVFFRSA
nr:MAG TPA: hypothetical protein [Bacteriophage sp.]